MRELIFVVNPASGDGRGRLLAGQLSRLAPDSQVVALGGGLGQIASAAQQTGAALVACGGDGTAAAVLEAAFQAQRARPGLPPPPVGILPLGTGNDLARVLGWRAPGLGDRALLLAIGRLRAGCAAVLDHWVLRGPGIARAWFNYWSVGIDARIVARFHDTRQRHPRLVRGSLTNRVVYAALGAATRSPLLAGWSRATYPGLSPSPPWASSLVMASIPSYAGGVRLCRGQQCDDGLAEVVALAQGVALGLVTAGWRRPLRLGSVRGLRIEIDRPGAMQCDGEPFLAQIGSYAIEHAGQVRVLHRGV